MFFVFGRLGRKALTSSDRPDIMHRTLITAFCLLELGFGTAHAQPAAAPPTSLTGDRMPPADPWAPRPARTGKPPPEALSTAPSPTLESATTAARTAIAACDAKGFKVGAAVVDASGQPRAMMAADGALGGHGYTGVRKALMALAFQMPTSRAAALAASDPSERTKVTPAMMPWAGAVPLWSHGQIIGAIGVSGASSLQDESCAAAGASAIGAGS